MLTRLLGLLALCATAATFTLAPNASQAQPLRIVIDDPTIEPLPFAVPSFQPESGEAGQLAVDLARVVSEDLTGTGLFREIPASAYISTVSDFNAPVEYADWKAINAQALITGAVNVTGNSVNVKFRVYDVFSGEELLDSSGQGGLQFSGTVDGWRRMAHKVADAVYSRITGEGGYFDSRVVFVSETGPKDDRQKRLAVMDYDGANLKYLTDSGSIVLAPRFSPSGDRVLYTSYESGFPRIYVLDIGTSRRAFRPAVRRLSIR